MDRDEIMEKNITLGTERCASIVTLCTIQIKLFLKLHKTRIISNLVLKYSVKCPYIIIVIIFYYYTFVTAINCQCINNGRIVRLIQL